MSLEVAAVYFPRKLAWDNASGRPETLRTEKGTCRKWGPGRSAQRLSVGCQSKQSVG